MESNVVINQGMETLAGMPGDKLRAAQSINAQLICDPTGQNHNSTEAKLLRASDQFKQNILIAIGEIISRGDAICLQVAETRNVILQFLKRIQRRLNEKKRFSLSSKLAHVESGNIDRINELMNGIIKQIENIFLPDIEFVCPDSISSLLDRIGDDAFGLLISLVTEIRDIRASRSTTFDIVDDRVFESYLGDGFRNMPYVEDLKSMNIGILNELIVHLSQERSKRFK